MNLDASVKSSFAPVIDARTRVVVFGSLPGEESLRRGEYYAKSSNQFWRLIGAVLDAGDLRDLAYDMRLETLLAAGIGLWDVVGSARRRGSLDANIQDASANRLSTFRDEHPGLKAFAFNGAKAFEVGRRQLADGSIPLLSLPSSSAAYCAMSLHEKATRWKAVAAYLEMA